MFDMTQCKIGDKLVTKGGKVVYYVANDGHFRYPHNISYYQGSDGYDYSVGNTGEEFIGVDSVNNNIVGFAEDQPAPEQLVPEQPTTVSVRKEDRYFITVNDKEVEITLEELRQLYSQLYNMLEGK